MEVAYQGSGRLANGDILQLASGRTEEDFRYFLIQANECNGYPRAGNQTCAVPYQTGAVALRESERLVPVGATVFIVELNLQVRINDTGSDVESTQIDLYTGYNNDFSYDKNYDATVWRLVRED